MDTFEPAPTVRYDDLTPGGPTNCPHCGAPLEDSSLYCPLCNESIADSELVDEQAVDPLSRAAAPGVTLVIVGVAVALALLGVGVYVLLRPVLGGLFR